MSNDDSLSAMTDDELDRLAAEAMGWAELTSNRGSGWLGKPPPGIPKLAGASFVDPVPRPSRDHGDALRLLEYVLRTRNTQVCAEGDERILHEITVEIDTFHVFMGPTEGRLLKSGVSKSLPRAITEACLAALQAVARAKEEVEA